MVEVFSWLAGRLRIALRFLLEGVSCTYVDAILFALHDMYLWFIEDIFDGKRSSRHYRHDHHQLSHEASRTPGLVRMSIIDVVGWTCYMTMGSVIPCV